MKLNLHTPLLVLLSVCSLSSFAKTVSQNDRPSSVFSGFKSLEFETYLSASSAQSDYFNAEYVNFEFRLAGEQELTNRFSLLFDTQAKARKSSLTYVEEEHGEAYESVSRIQVREAKVRYLNLDETLIFEAGLINQKVQSNKLVVGRTAHLGLREGLAFKTNFGIIEISASQSKPQVSTYSENNEKVDTEQATFFNENIRLVSNISNKLNTEVIVGHHAYNNLGTSIAYNSLFKGNTVYGTTERNTVFAYGFNGWNYALNAKYFLNPKFELDVFYLGVNNTKAPQGKNLGNVLGGSVTLKNSVNSYSFEYSYGVVDSDATPGSFMSYADFKTNNTTSNAWLKYENTKDNYSVKLLYQESSVINPIELIQSDETKIQLQMSKIYEIF